MSSHEASSSAEPTLAPEDVSDRTFPTAFRGFDPVEVRAFLGQVADELRAARQRESELRALVEAGGPAPTPVAHDAVNDEAVRTIEEAEAAAAALRAKVEQESEATVAAARLEADRLVREAKERVAQLGHAATAESARLLDQAREQAKQVIRSKAEDAEATAVKKIADAERDAASIRVKAREDADAILDAAKERGREMVAEAQAARERMIADLNKRKRAAAAQLDQLRTGRDRLLESLRVVRRNLDEITTRLEATEGVAAPVAATPEPAAADTTQPGSAVTMVSSAQPNEARRPPRSSRVVLGELPGAPPAASAAAQAQAAQAQAAATIDDVAQPVPPQVVSTTPVRTGAVGTTPRIDAPRARAAVGDDTPPAGTPTTKPAADGPPQEERKSSALRILRRRAKPADTGATPVEIGRDSPGEGVRIIKDPEPLPAAGSEGPDDGRTTAAPAAGPGAGASSEREPDAQEPSADHELEPPPEAVDGDTAADRVVAESSVAADREGAERVNADAEVVDEIAIAGAAGETGGDAGVVGAAGDEARAAEVVDVESVELPPEVSDDELPPPLRPEEVRPRIEDLFARIRADREAAVAKARAVLSSDEGPPSEPVMAADGRHDGPDAVAEPEQQLAPDAVVAVEQGSQQQEGGDTGDTAGINGQAVSDGDEHLLQARDVVVDPLVGQLTRRLKRSIQDEQNATLDRLRTARARPGVEEVLAAAETQPAPYRYAALPILEEAARAASANAPFGAVGVGVDDLAQALAEEIASQIRSKLERVLTAAADEDVDLQTASERVSSVYREWKTQRVEAVASYYLVAAWSRGTFVATPEGTPMRWIVDDDAPCPDCDDNALAGPTARGRAFPTGQLHPPAHPGCRCLLVPLQG